MKSCFQDKLLLIIPVKSSEHRKYCRIIPFFFNLNHKFSPRLFDKIKNVSRSVWSCFQDKLLFSFFITHKFSPNFLTNPFERLFLFILIF